MGEWYIAIPPLCRGHTVLTPVDNFSRTMLEDFPNEVKAAVINVSVVGCQIIVNESNRKVFA